MHPPAILWDSWVCEKALLLGLNHVRSKLPLHADDFDKARARAKSDLDDLFRCSLVRTCHRYGVPFAMEGHKERLQKSFLSHPEGASFTQEQIRYSAEDSLAAARLYPLQVAKATQRGIVHHLIQTEMPWTVTNARIEWNGVRIDKEKCQQLLGTAGRHVEVLQHRLSHEHDIANFRSHRDLVAFFEHEGILDLFYDGQKWSFDKKMLKLHRDRHPVIPLLQVARFVAALPKDKIVDPWLVGVDRRVHPVHQQLGAMTGRQTAKWPNILGVSRILRPLVVPEDGYGIGEVDWSQMEVGVAAAVYHDERLTEMFNTGDVYSAMGQAFYSDRLTPEEQTMPGREFKKHYPKIRAQMKICTLGMIYGITAYGLSQQLGVSHHEAEAMLNRFIGLFPMIRQALSEIPYTDPVRGYATTTTGLRRYRAEKGQLQGWERNWMVNFPVQGTAAAMMKEAGNRLDALYQGYHAKLIIPLHDSFIFEAPLPHLRTVAELTRQVMCLVVQEHFPQLRPRADVNIDHPEAWNKDGDVEAFTRWMEDPEEGV